MHSSRMRTARSNSRHRGGSPLSPREQAPPRAEPPRSRHPPWPDPSQLPPWVWAWTRSPSISPFSVGLDQIPLNFPLACGPGAPPPQPDLPKLPPWVWAWKPARNAGIPPPPPRPAVRHAGIPPAVHAGIAPPPGQNS